MDRAITVKNVAAEYGVSCDTVYRWIKSGMLRPIRLPGGDYRFRREHLEEFDQQCRVQGSTDPTTDYASEEADTSLTGPTMASRDPFQRGKQMSAPPNNGSPSSSPVVRLSSPHRSRR